MVEAVNHPLHYGGEDNPYEAIKVIEAWGLGFNLGNTTKYISRAGFKDPAKELEDLKKARWYLDREIQNQERAQAAITEQANQSRADAESQHLTLASLSDQEESQKEETPDVSKYHGTVTQFGGVATPVPTEEEPSH